MPEVALAVDGVSRKFVHLQAVSDVSFQVLVGERVAIIGPNGAGKSTLLGMISGQIECDEGTISYLGSDITRMPDHQRARLGISRSFQIPSVFSEFTIADNVRLALSADGSMRRVEPRDAAIDRETVKSVLHAWRLWDHRNGTPAQLSHGDRRRLELALAFAVKPRLALLDEPTAGLTLEEGPKLMKEVAELGREVTVVLVDHDMTAIFSIAERIIVMHRGSIIADGSPEEVRRSDLVREVYGAVEGSH